MGQHPFDDGATFSSSSSLYSLNGKLMIAAAILVLFLVVTFILALHIYAKWFWRNAYVPTGHRQAYWRRRRRLNFVGEEDFEIVGSMGLEKTIVDALPIFVYQLPLSDDDVLECAVCLCEFQENEQGRSLPKCNHSFHTECIDMWFHSHSTCPLCRTSARPDTLPDASHSHQQVNVTSTEDIVLLPRPNSEIPEQVGIMEATRSPSQIIDSDLCSPSMVDWRDWRTTNSERFQQNQGMGYPSNVPFWGNCTHVSSRASSPRLEQNQSGTRSIPHIVIDIPRRSESFLPRRYSLTPSTSRRGKNGASSPCAVIEEFSSPNGQPLESPVARLKNLKRLLSRERKISPTEYGGDCNKGGSISST